MAKILIGISGSIAAYKIIGLSHTLIKEGHEVKVILTANALNFVTKASFTAFGIQVYTDELNYSDAKEVMQHVILAKWPDMILIAPAGANVIGKIANGIADNILTSTILASIAPIFIIPAMNKYMWSNWAVQENVKKLMKNNINFWGPCFGLQACGDDGLGRMLEVDEILSKIYQYIEPKQSTLKGKKIVITAGATKEAIDPVRFISNNSSGKMGYAITQAGISLGAEIVLISGLVTMNKIPGVRIVNVETSHEMLKAVHEECIDANIFIGGALAKEKVIAMCASKFICIVDEFYLLDKGHLNKFNGDLEEYHKILLAESSEQKTTKVKKESNEKNILNKVDFAPKNIIKIKIEIDKIEKEMAILQDKINKAEIIMATIDCKVPKGISEFEHISKEYNSNKLILDELESKWLSLQSEIE